MVRGHEAVPVIRRRISRRQCYFKTASDARSVHRRTGLEDTYVPRCGIFGATLNPSPESRTLRSAQGSEPPCTIFPRSSAGGVVPRVNYRTPDNKTKYLTS